MCANVTPFDAKAKQNNQIQRDNSCGEFGNFRHGNLDERTEGSSAMKTTVNNPPAVGDAPKSRPPPALHASPEPEYDRKQLAQRANQVTQVLEHILEEQVIPPGRNPGVPPSARP